MTTVNVAESKNKAEERNLFSYYAVFKKSIYTELKRSVYEFFRKEYDIKFMGVTTGENVLYYGSEYFVNKIPVNKNEEIKINISSDFIGTLLTDTFGAIEGKFSLKKLTDLEALLLKDFTVFICENIEKYTDKTEVNKKTVKNKRKCCFTFYVRSGSTHTGKILITIPEYILTNLESPAFKDTFTIGDFKTTCTFANIMTGYTKIRLNEMKALEEGDILVLDESNINTMAVVRDGMTIPFRVRPNPAIVLGIDTEGEDEMSEDKEINPQNMWDSILVDIIAEFNDVKLTLGELKQISEGLVVDVGSVYDNKIKLKVENQTVASGELVIINDRYGVRITEVTKMKEEAPSGEKAQSKAAPVSAAKAAAAEGQTVKEKAPAAKRPAAQSAKAPAAKPAAKQPAKAQEGQEGGENGEFDYRDFEIEDESI